jgi:hypothetical protein
VEPGSPADKAGLKPKDVLRWYEVKKKLYPLRTQTDWALFLEKLKPEETYDLIVRREGTHRLVQLIAAAIPENQPSADPTSPWHD